MSERAPYSRVYWSIVDDPKFSTVFDDDRCLATWLRLLILADQAHPASAAVPLGTNVKALDKLVAVGLIDRGAGNRFRVHGLDKERARRRPVIAGPAPEPDPDGSSPGPVLDHDRNGTQGLSKAEQSKDETSTDKQGARASDPADVLWTLSGRYPADKALAWVDDLTAKYGPEAVIRAIATANAQDRNGSTLLGRSQDLLRSQARALNLKEQVAERERLQAKRAEPRIVPDRDAVNAELRRLMGLDAA